MYIIISQTRNHKNIEKFYATFNDFRNNNDIPIDENLLTICQDLEQVNRFIYNVNNVEGRIYELSSNQKLI